MWYTEDNVGVFFVSGITEWSTTNLTEENKYTLVFL